MPTKLLSTQRLMLLLALAVVAPAFANPAHKMLSDMSEQERARAITGFLRKSGESCDSATRTFYQGSEKNGNAHWAVACKNGRSYLVQVMNDSVGSTRILDCKVLKAVAGSECFKKYK